MEENFEGMFPLNQRKEQHDKFINEDRAVEECALLAEKILGVTCNDTVTTGDNETGANIKYYQITPEPYEAETSALKSEFMAFNNYFYKNYGIHQERCYFYTPQDAFYQVVKAWHIWTLVFTEEQRQEYFNDF